MNLFVTALTYSAPSSNYRGESEENRAVIQKVSEGRFEYAIISPEAIRNALRETLRGYGVKLNRTRLNNEDQLAVRFEDYPWAEEYADDFLFGYMVADRKQVPKEVLGSRKDFEFKRDSVLRTNMAKALEPYRDDAVFTQSPLTIKNPSAPWQNAASSALLHRETSVTAFQYPFAINLDDCRLDDPANGAKFKGWLRDLLKAVSELNNVAGNHARSYFEMAPASVVIRVTDSLVANYNTYGFTSDGNFPEVIDGILHDDFPGDEFILGGQIVKRVLAEDAIQQLEAKGARLFRMANQALDQLARDICGDGFLKASPVSGGA